MIEFPPGRADIPVARELDERPVARLAFFAAELRGQAAAIYDDFLRKLGPGELRKRRHKIGRIHHVGAEFSSGSPAGPIHDHRHERPAFEQVALGAGKAAAVDRGAVGVVSTGAIVAEKDDEGFLAELQPIEFGDELAHQFVHVGDVIGVEIFAVRGAVWRGQDFPVDVRYLIIEVERLLAIPGHEIDGVAVHGVR